MTNLYQWQHTDYVALSQSIDRPSQALLIAAKPGMAQEILIDHYIALLLCLSPKMVDNVAYACDECQPCVLLKSGNNPDFYPLVPPVDKKQVSAQDVREVLEFLATTTHLGRYKIVLIPSVELLSISSANALLKILEEPPEYAIFILYTTNVSGMLATLRSRCHIYKLVALAPLENVDNATYAQNPEIFKPQFWYSYYDGTALFELEITEVQFDLLIRALLQPSIENIFALSGGFEALHTGFLINFLSKWLTDLAGYLQGAPLRYFMEYTSQIDKLSNRIDLKKVFYLFDRVNFLQEWTLHPLNHKLQLENLLLQYQSLFISK